MKSFKTFCEDLELQPRTKFAIPGKDINFKGPKPTGFLGDTFNGQQFPIEFKFKLPPKGKRAKHLNKYRKR